ncbi:MAG: CRISPR-associated endonuclease Cas2 [bacterium]
MKPAYFVMVTYDVRENRRRAKIANELKNYGQRVQYSVFECRVDADHDRKMREIIGKLISEEEDNLRYYCLCETCVQNVEIVGSGHITEDEDMWIV